MTNILVLVHSWVSRELLEIAPAISSHRLGVSSVAPGGRVRVPSGDNTELDDTLPDHVTLSDLAADPPELWEVQRRNLHPDD